MFIGDSINLRKKYHINKYNYRLLHSLTVLRYGADLAIANLISYRLLSLGYLNFR